MRRIAKPLGFEEDELFTLAGYLSPQAEVAEECTPYRGGQLDPYVSRVLAQEPFEVQRVAVSILTILKSMAKSLTDEPSQN